MPRPLHGGIANVGPGGQRKGQRALSAPITPRPPRTTTTFLFNRETFDQTENSHLL